MPAYGTKRTCRDVRLESAFGGKPDIEALHLDETRVPYRGRVGVGCDISQRLRLLPPLLRK
jgi:hypothetical protein